MNAKKHQEYLEHLQTPTSSQVQRINDIQLRHEAEILQRYQNREHHDAARTIQRAYRDHRGRRQANGLILDPSQRWTELLKDWQWRAMASSQREASGLSGARPRAESDVAKLHWKHAVLVAEQVSGGPRSNRSNSNAKAATCASTAKRKKIEQNEDLQMDSRYFLEMVDRKHRYGPNLRIYHEEWERSQVNQNFFQWLDEGPAKHLDLPGCSREKLDRERVRYLSKEERNNYLVEVDEKGRLCWARSGELITTSAELYRDTKNGIVLSSSEAEDNDSLALDSPAVDEDFEVHEHDQHLTSLLDIENLKLAETPSHASGDPKDNTITPTSQQVHTVRRRHHVSPATILQHLLRATVRPGTWIYVADTVGRLYVGIKSSGAFQHASFLSGGRIASAGSIGITDGKLTYLSPLSGHYRPTTKSFRAFVANLKDAGVDLSELKTSKAYAILLGMECYSKTKMGLMKVLHHGDSKPAKKSEKRMSLT
jgi:hypothetical protein